VTQAAPITIAAMASFYDFRMTSITGEQVDFDRFRDQVLLVVNVASR
jgi:glutathione peroxidase-family protein